MRSWSGCPKSGKQKDRLRSSCPQIGVKDWTRPDFKTLVTDDDPNEGVKKGLDVVSICVAHREMLLEQHAGDRSRLTGGDLMTTGKWLSRC